jgi:hypothetical protein
MEREENERENNKEEKSCCQGKTIQHTCVLMLSFYNLLGLCYFWLASGVDQVSCAETCITQLIQQSYYRPKCPQFQNFFTGPTGVCYRFSSDGSVYDLMVRYGIGDLKFPEVSGLKTKPSTIVQIWSLYLRTATTSNAILHQDLK